MIVLCNVPDIALARQIARTLVEQQLAACVNLLPAVASVYRWQGQVEEAEEIPLLIKTSHASYPALQDALCALHPYTLPEIIALPIDTGLPAYLDWVRTETRHPAAPTSTPTFPEDTP